MGLDGDSAVVGKGLNAAFHELSSAFACVFSATKRVPAKQILLALAARADNEFRLMVLSPQNRSPMLYFTHL